MIHWRNHVLWLRFAYLNAFVIKIFAYLALLIELSMTPFVFLDIEATNKVAPTITPVLWR